MVTQPDMKNDVEARFLRLLSRVSANICFVTYIIFDNSLNLRGEVAVKLLASNLPESFRHHYLETRAFERDPLVRVLQAARRPVRTADIQAAAEADPELMAGFRAAAGALGAAVVAIPLRFRGRLGGQVVFRRHGAEFTDAEVEYCELVAPALHLAAAELPAAASTDDLTPRERECLAWTSVGKTAWEIGSILGISEHTAVAHLNAAVRKLRAASRAQAVAEALRRRLID
jgi:DNA-binding CsgD family transcriptional regulator